MAVGGSGLSALFWVEPITPGDVASWLTDGVLKDGGGGGTTLSIGASIVGGTQGSVLFVGPGSVLAQDNANFFWDDTNHILKLEGPGQLQVYNVDDHAGNFERGVMDWVTNSNILTIGVPPSGAGGTGVLREARLYTAGLPAIYRVANASGDNWFEGDAGNFTTTGSNNFGTGSLCLANVTTGFNNVGVGSLALGGLTTGSNNFALGSRALTNMGTGTNNIGIGDASMFNLSTGSSAIAIGQFALGTATTCTESVAIGQSALSTGSTSFKCVAVGSLALANNANQYCVGIGTSSGHNSTGQNGTFVGAFAAVGLVTGDNNTIIGNQSAISMSAGNGNTIVGFAGGLNLTGTSNYNTMVGTWYGPSASASNIISLADGTQPSDPQLSYNYPTSHVWSMQNATSAQGLHIYNTTSGGTSPTNYERGVFDWNITSNTLIIGTPTSSAGGTGTLRDIQIWSAGIPALYRVPNASGDNWFEGGSGNTTVSGSGNYATGSTSMQVITTGSRNAAIGTAALQGITTGTDNVALGTGSLQQLQSGIENMAVGHQTLFRNLTGNHNVAIGNVALFNLNSAGNESDNVALGFQAAQALTGGTSNVFIGGGVASNMTGATGNTIIGGNSGQGYSGNTIGLTLIGFNAGTFITGGNANTLIGTWGGPAASVSNIIAFSDGSVPTSPQLDYNFTHANCWTFPAASPVIPASTVAGLPAAGTVGRRATVTDATVFTFGTIVIGGGADTVPVYDDGTNWRIG